MPTATAKQRGPYAKTAALQSRILETCIELFGQTGFHNLTMKEVAQRAGISHTGLLHHFANKDELLSGVLKLRDQKRKEFFLERGVDVLTVPASTAAIKAMLKTVAANDLQPGLIELHSTLSTEATSPDHPAHDYYRQRYASSIGLYTRAFAALAERGELKSDIAPEDLAAMFVALTDGLQIQWLYDRDTERIKRHVRLFLRSFIPGID
ncbi:TetR/AcrR family transcriptional regulator [Pseudarthrobacter sp. NS4]|uniref:TetR/AcrR family transcriptional regulator n=1 Tax=Pseudarthrobacter sp. NS4 TaxID=2973976 RepID=UPI00216271A1|nr:TetR/AcrR family transcriptional regulator [Pseudarthrobacter sp. NS4]